MGRLRAVRLASLPGECLRGLAPRHHMHLLRHPATRCRRVGGSVAPPARRSTATCSTTARGRAPRRRGTLASGRGDPTSDTPLPSRDSRAGCPPPRSVRAPARPSTRAVRRSTPPRPRWRGGDEMAGLVPDRHQRLGKVESRRAGRGKRRPVGERREWLADPRREVDRLVGAIPDRHTEHVPSVELPDRCLALLEDDRPLRARPATHGNGAADRNPHGLLEQRLQAPLLERDRARASLKPAEAHRSRWLIPRSTRGRMRHLARLGRFRPCLEAVGLSARPCASRGRGLPRRPASPAPRLTSQSGRLTPRRRRISWNHPSSLGVAPRAPLTPSSYPQRMADRLRVACVQLNAGADKPANLEKAERLVARAAATGADVVVLPEKWNAIGGPDVFRANAETVESGETFASLSSWARRHGVTIVGRLRYGAPRRAREALQYLPGVRPSGRARRPLPQDPHVRRRGRGSGLPRVGSRGARRGAGRLRGRRLEARSYRLL